MCVDRRRASQRLRSRPVHARRRRLRGGTSGRQPGVIDVDVNVPSAGDITINSLDIPTDFQFFGAWYRLEFALDTVFFPSGPLTYTGRRRPSASPAK